ncbi:FG-GAP-like repeat-containing protein [Streptomyces sp. NPDC051098]|uniref:FG-GAP-like repeat-containing protein n=1 Tax=Streptomyces sp. NPDC051098 TaxID=3155411 RepID=UPI0034403D7C
MSAGTAWADGGEDCAPLELASLGGTSAEAMGRTTVPANGSACFTIGVERPGMHRVLTGNDVLYAQVYDGEQRLDCTNQAAPHTSGWCDLPRSGTYTIRLPNHWDEAMTGTLVVIPLGTGTEDCTGQDVHTSFSSPGATGTVPDPFTVVCHRLVAEPGERLSLDPHAGGMAVEAWISDKSGALICPNPNADGSRGCVLPGDGPYRVLVRVAKPEQGFPATYTLDARRLSNPAGCATVPVNPYGSAPTTAEPNVDCKVFRATTAGRYDVYAVTTGYRNDTLVYDNAGRTVCTGAPCTFAADGDYTILTEGSTLVLDRTSTAGCEPAVLGVNTGTWDASAAVDCLTLPLPTGARMAALTSFSGFGPTPDVTVVDAHGGTLCYASTLSSGSCDLRGPAPYRALVSHDDGSPGNTSYRVAFHRTDAPASGCRAFPAGDFTDATASVRVRTGADGDGFSDCLAIPADEHSAIENVQMRTVSGTGGAAFSILDAAGTQICTMSTSAPSTWTTCRLTPGAAYTALFRGRDAPGEYTLIRRDVTGTAKGCTPTPATAVGGPSTPGVPGPPGTLMCHQVTTADASDVLHLNVRDPLGTTNIQAYGTDEAVRTCTNRNKSCAVTGSSRYQVLLSVPSSLKAAGSYRLDTLRVATATGPAPECVKVPDITYGYGPVVGALDEQHPAYCAQLPTAWADSFTVKVSDTNGAIDTAVPALYEQDLDNTCSTTSDGDSSCGLTGSSTAGAVPSLFVLGLPEKASQTSYKAELVCRSAYCGTERPGVTGLTPTAGVAGTGVTVTVSGSALHKDDKVRISFGDRTVESTTTAVAADRKTLTAVLDLTGTAAGRWNISVATRRATHNLGGFTVAPAPLKNTAAPTVTGATQVGSKVTATAGTWAPAAASYAYQWKADGQAISGATASTYLVPASLRNKKLTVAVTAGKEGWQSATAQSAARTVSPARRDHAGANAQPDGAGDLLSLSASGALTFHHGSGAGTFVGTTGASGWSTSSLAVPFGDLNGDGCNDVLVRLPSGELRAHRPACGKALTPTTAYTSLGTVWAQFNVLTSPGDLTGDGRADLVARQASTGDMYLYANDGAGKLKARGRIGTNWKLYRAVFGAGDLNGDGIGDLLAVDGANSLWRYDGTPAGTLKPRVLVFGNNWATGRNVFVGVGDLNKDGKADLVSRNAAGDLLRNNGNGAGSLSSTVKISTSWKAYKGLF